jgi:biopolymer transport protein ExbD
MPINKKKIPQINGGSLADISFLMLTFFLLTTTMDTDRGIARMLPPFSDQTEEIDIRIRERDVLPVQINHRNEVGVRGQPIHLSQLKGITKDFLQNIEDLPNLPERFYTEVEFFGLIPITKNAVISLQTDRGTQYQVYLTVQNELQAAYNELRNEVAKRKFNLPYDELNDDQQRAIRVIYPQRISEAEPRNIRR